MPQVTTPPSLSRTSIENMIKTMIDRRLKPYMNILDGVALEELTNFSVPLTGQQTPDQQEDGLILSYKDGKLVEETNLNGGTF